MGQIVDRRPLLKVAASGVALVLIAGCSKTSDAGISTAEPRTEAAHDGVRQTDDLGQILPFVTKHSRRWSRANDGTSYEPCTAVEDAHLLAIGIEPTSVRDAAGTDGQTLRGCTWDAFLVDGRRSWSLSQFVGNSPSLESDKRRKSSAGDVWLPDLEIDNRVVGVHRWSGGDDCATYVQSGRAAVDTLVLYLGSAHPAPEEICAKAIAFTRATIGKIPR